MTVGVFVAVWSFNKNYMRVTHSSGPGKCYLGFSPRLSCSLFYCLLAILTEKLLFLLQHFLKNSKARKE